MRVTSKGEVTYGVDSHTILTLEFASQSVVFIHFLRREETEDVVQCNIFNVINDLGVKHV